jgi:glycine hydroxymethyltransferase
MKEPEMVEIAQFVKRVIINKESPEKVATDVAEFRREFQKVHYCFENATEAYKYIRIR